MISLRRAEDGWVCKMLTSPTWRAKGERTQRLSSDAEAPVPRAPYHHGDLRRVIVKAALEILRETQILEFSLVSSPARRRRHNAPSKHFADKREDLGAVWRQGSKC